jgi:hypothetical protein
MDYTTLATLRNEHPAWKLLAADSGPFVLSSLYRHFVAPNVRTLTKTELSARIDDDLYQLNASQVVFPRSALQYIDDWCAPEKAWLRKYYPPGTDEPSYDLTPATEKAIEWISELRDRPFVGTESRLLTVFELLRQISQGTELRPDARLAELENQKVALEKEIQRVLRGEFDVMDATQVKDRFIQMATTARGLLADLRDVEQNFRRLDREARERIATWSAGRGALLDVIFEERDAIEQSDQGRSFRAFWDFLMSPERQGELTELLERVLALEAVQSLNPDPRLSRIHYDWLEAGELAQRTVARLSEQLRKYLDDRGINESRRIVALLRDIERFALERRQEYPDGPTMEIDWLHPVINLPLSRPLFARSVQTQLVAEPLENGVEAVDLTALFNQRFVDRRRLEGNIQRALRAKDQVSLPDVLTDNPLTEGLAELVTYLSIAADDTHSVFDDTTRSLIEWSDEMGNSRVATVPLVIFIRRN